MALKRIPISSAQVGMYLCGIDRSWINTPFLIHRFFLKSSADIDALHQCGIEEITIDTDRGLDVPSDMESAPLHRETFSTSRDLDTTGSGQSEAERIQNLPPTVQGKSLSGELTAMKLVRTHMLASVEDMIQTLSQSRAVDLEQIQHVTQSIMHETLGHEDACIVMIRTRDFSPTLYEHALSVSTLAVLLGRALGLTDTTLQHLAMAGLLHDAGHLKIPQSLHRPLNQLSKSELNVFQTHPRRGIELLSQTCPLSQEVETMILEHHHVMSGSGDPSPAHPNQAPVQTPSRILRIVDEYDELLNGHQTGRPMSVRVALQTMYQHSQKGHLDGTLVASLINLIGIYPTYGLVELSTGERGIVTANSRENLLQPTILLIQDADHRPLPEPIPFNFSVLSSNGIRPEIVQVLPPEQLGIDVHSALENWMTL